MHAVPGDAPSMIRSFALGSTSVRVRWSPPFFSNGVITGYTVYYSLSTTTANVTVGGGVMSHDLNGLPPHTNFTIRVSASTSEGEGPLGPQEGLVVTTEEDGEK